MLTDDVRAHSQFRLPKSTVTEKETSSQQLRKEFQLPNEAPLAIESIESVTEFNQAELVSNNQLDCLRLVNTLSPKPLAFRDDFTHVPSYVMSNTSLYCQQKHKKPSLINSEVRSDFNVNSWLNAVKTAMVKEPLMEAYA